MSMRRTWTVFLLGASLAGATTASAQNTPPTQAPSRETAAQERKGESRQVAREYEMQARANPTDATPKARAAELYETMGDLTAAKTAATEALTRDANNVDALQLLGRIAARQQDWDAAVVQFRRAAFLDPANAAAQLDLGQALEQLGDRDGSDAAYAAYRALLGPPALPASE
jgi:Flp pilus assembly protein TadD